LLDLDFAQIDSGKRLMGARGHSNHPEPLSLLIDRTPTSHVHERTAHPMAEPSHAARDDERIVEVQSSRDSSSKYLPPRIQYGR
jgi:nitrilase